MDSLQKLKNIRLSPSFQNKALEICSMAGMFYCSRFAIQSLHWFIKNFCVFSSDLKKKYGDGWVVVTGGSAGIGLALAKKFAKEKFKILLISRSQDKLAEAQKSILEEVNDATVKTVTFDFDKEYTKEQIDDFQLKIQDYISDVSVLVNNVGFINRDAIADQPDDKIRTMTNVNIRTLVFVTKYILNAMLKRESRSLIIGSGSMAAFIKFPTRSIYASCKIFMRSFLSSISREYKDKIDCTYLTIGSVATELNQEKQPHRIAASDYAKSAIKMVGKYESCAGHYVHAWSMFLFSSYPEFYKNRYRTYLSGLRKKVKKI